MLRKLLRHSNVICLTLTGVAWLATIGVRFMWLHEQVPPSDWLLWTICNNLMVAGFAYQLGVISFRHEGRKRRWFKRDANIDSNSPGDSKLVRHTVSQLRHRES